MEKAQLKTNDIFLNKYSTYFAKCLNFPKHAGNSFKNKFTNSKVDISLGPKKSICYLLILIGI